MSEARHAIVEVRFGPSRGRKVTIAPGGSARVGRSERADLAVPRDASLAGLHFEIAWDGARCSMRALKDAAYEGLRGDLADAGVTWLNGERAAAGPVANGSFIRAGATIFMVYIEASTPPLRMQDGARELPVAAREAALDELRAVPTPLYAMLDAARDRRVLVLLRESVEEHLSLYDGVRGEAMAESAPYVVPLPKDGRLLASLVLEGFGRRWGVFFTSPAAPVDVRRHLRRFLLVADDETDRTLFFRLFDPRVLGDFLATCTPRQRALLFADVDRFFVEDRDGRLATHGRTP